MHQSARHFIELFDGYREAFGTYMVPPDAKADGGGKMKGRAATVHREVTVELWDSHLTGNCGLGIIPINRESKCRFAAIDVDQYPLDHVQLCQQVARLKLPLIVVRTKSGGAHLYLFTTELVPAKLMFEKMREFAAALGYGNCELFPRQTQILPDRGDIGQWINMPYFDGKRTTRYGFDDRGTAILEPQAFHTHASGRALTPAQLEGFVIEMQEPLQGGPPCLNQLCVQGFPEGTRNTGLLNLGVYAKKADPDKWVAMLEELNNKYMNPPLSTAEVLGVQQSLKKKSYNYTCKQQPVMSYCQAARCRQCKHGIGDGDFGMPKMGTLTKVGTVPPVWFIDVEGGSRLELSTEELQNPIAFQRRCMDVLNIMPIIPKRESWHDIVSKLMATVHVIDVDESDTPKGTLRQHFEDFLCSRVQARTPDEILLGKPLFIDGRHYFRMADFLRYLDRMKFDIFRQNRVVHWVGDRDGVQKVFWNLKGKGVNLWSVPEIKNKQTEGHAPPRVEQVPY